MVRNVKSVKKGSRVDWVNVWKLVSLDSSLFVLYFYLEAAWMTIASNVHHLEEAAISVTLVITLNREQENAKVRKAYLASLDMQLWSSRVS